MSTIPADRQLPGVKPYKTDDFFQKQHKPITLFPLASYDIGTKQIFPGIQETSHRNTLANPKLLERYNDEHGMRRTVVFVILAHVNGLPVVLTIKSNSNNKKKNKGVSLPGAVLQPEEDELLGIQRALHERFDPLNKVDFLRLKLLSGKAAAERRRKVEKNRQLKKKGNEGEQEKIESKNRNLALLKKKGANADMKGNGHPNGKEKNNEIEKEKQNGDNGNDQDTNMTDAGRVSNQQSESSYGKDTSKQSKDGIKIAQDEDENFESGNDANNDELADYETDLIEPPTYLPQQQPLHIVACIGRYWRPEANDNLYPYLPPHITKPKELVKIYLITLPRRRILQCPRNLGTIFPMSIYDIQQHKSHSGGLRGSSQMLLHSVPLLISQFNFQYASREGPNSKQQTIIKQDPVLGKYVAKRKKAFFNQLKRNKKQKVVSKDENVLIDEDWDNNDSEHLDGNKLHDSEDEEITDLGEIDETTQTAKSLKYTDDSNTKPQTQEETKPQKESQLENNNDGAAETVSVGETKQQSQPVANVHMLA